MAGSRAAIASHFANPRGAVYHSRARPWKTLDGGSHAWPAGTAVAGGRVGAPGSCARYPHFIARLPNWRQIWLTALLTVTVGRGDRSPASIRITQGIHERQAITLASQAHSARRRRRLYAWISERALAKAGYEVIAFANGREAHERLKQEPFTLLLTDIVMPLMDGIELARRAAELDPELKIMFITGFAAVTLNTNNPMPRDARVLSKPFHLKDLVREIDRLLT